MKNKILKQIKEKAFTLAETLIVIGVIGVVAALTLPNLNSSTGDKEKIAKIKKIYSNLTDAFERAQAVYGPIDEWYNGFDYLEDANEIAKRESERIIEFLKISKNCGKDKGCFPTHMGEIKEPEEGEEEGVPYDEYSVITADGTGIDFVYYPGGGSGPSLSMWVDLDGPQKGKNETGYDIFEFYVDFNQNPPILVPDCQSFNFANLVYFSVQKACGAAWMINFDNTDYMKIKDTQGNCENGNKVTEDNPRCQ